ncbi:MAG TPA: hypothetical protein VMW31_05710, partial [Devosiaceae bacterium]|nr:hypothetical protein [Devosiaceae bacterium]
MIAIVQAKRRRDVEQTFAGLANLVAPAAELADLGRLTGAIDAVAGGAAGEAAGSGSDTRHDAVAQLLRETLAAGREKVRAGLLEQPHAGLKVARSYTHVTDVVVAGIFHYCAMHLHPAPIRT